MKTLKQIRPALEFAATHLDEDLSLASLARQAGLSEFHLHRLFTATAGESPKQYALRLRLARAAVALVSKDETILDIALECGFQSHEVFSRAFRRRFGITPSAYRERGPQAGADRAQIAGHAAIVDAVGPCLGVFRIAETGGNVSYSITKRTIAPQPVLVVQSRIPRSAIAATIAQSLGRVFQYAQSKGAVFVGQPFARYLDAGPGLITMETGMPLAAPLQGQGEVIGTTLPGGPAATTIHAGHYEKLVDAHAAVQGWIEEQKLVVAGPPWEVYVTDPAEHADPKDWKTEIFWPLQA